MLGTVLKFMKPSYALTALILFGGYQGYKVVKNVTEPPESKQAAAAEEQAENEPIDNAVLAAVHEIHPVGRMLSWLVLYGLLCFASTPIIKSVLARESNLANGIILFLYIMIGFLLALFFTAFQIGWFSGILVFLALGISAGIFISLAGALEKMRVEL